MGWGKGPEWLQASGEWAQNGCMVWTMGPEWLLGDGGWADNDFVGMESVPCGCIGIENGPGMAGREWGMGLEWLHGHGVDW